MAALAGAHATLPRTARGRRSVHWFGHLGDRLLEWRGRHRWRRRLLTLSDHMRKDIGMSSADAWREARKPFWQE